MGQFELLATFYKEWQIHPQRWLTVKEVASLNEDKGDVSKVYKQIKKLVIHGLVKREFVRMKWRNRYRFNKAYVKSIKKLIGI